MADQWTEIYDEGSGQYYFYNTVTGETSWENPNKPPVDSKSDSNPPALLPGWTQLFDEGSGTNYYYNEETGETRWDPPLAQEESKVSLPPGWTEVFDNDSQKTYYFNEQTGETSWEVPTDSSSNIAVSVDHVTEKAEKVEGPKEEKSLESHAQDNSEWIEHIDSTSGRVYYEHSVTHVTQWDSPYSQTAAVPEPSFDSSLSLYNSANLTLPSLPENVSEHPSQSPSASPSKNKRSGYLFAPDDFAEEYASLGKKKSSMSNLLGGNGLSQQNGGHSSSSSSLLAGKEFGEYDYSPEDWRKVVERIDDLHWENESNPLVVSDQLLSLPAEMLSSLPVLLYASRKLAGHFSLLHFAEHYFQYDRRVVMAGNSSGNSQGNSNNNNNSGQGTATKEPASRSNSITSATLAAQQQQQQQAASLGSPTAGQTGSNNAPSSSSSGNQALTNLLEKLISHQSEPLKSSLTVLNNHALVAEAVSTFKQIQLFMAVSPLAAANPAAFSSSAASNPSSNPNLPVPPGRRRTIFSNYLDLKQQASASNPNNPNSNGNGSPVNYFEIALKLIQVMLISSYEELNDEIFVQVVKQLKRNPSMESVELGYQLMLILLSAIPPSRRLLPYLLVFFAHNIDGPQLSNFHEVRKFAIFSLKNLLASFQAQAKRKELPTIYELQRLLLGERISLKVLCVDNQVLPVSVDSFTTVKTLEKEIIAALGILPENSNIFALFECCQPSASASARAGPGQENSSGGGGVLDGGLADHLVSLLAYNERLVDILSRWEKIDKITFDILSDSLGGPAPLDSTNTNTNSAGGQGQGQQSDGQTAPPAPGTQQQAAGSYFGSSSNSVLSSVLVGQHYLLWKVNFYFPLASPDGRDLAAKRLVFHQGIHDVVSGYYPHALQDALFLAALQLQQKYGDYVIGREIKELRSLSLLATILSPAWLQPSSAAPAKEGGQLVAGQAISRGEVETKIIAIYKRLQGVPSEQAMGLFLSFVQTWKLYGAKYFSVKGQAPNAPATPAHHPAAPQTDASQSQRNLILAVTLHSLVIIDSASLHFLADYHYEQIYSCGHSFESFVLIIGTKANQVKSYYRTNQGKDIEDILRIYLARHKNAVSPAPSASAGKDSASSAASSEQKASEASPEASN